MIIGYAGVCRSLNTTVAVLVAMLLLSACNDSDAPAPVPSPAPGHVAVTVTAATDFSQVGATSLIAVEPPRFASNNLEPTDTSDLAVECHGGNFYRIERFGKDNITRFSVERPEQVEYQYSTGSGSNPYAMAFVSDTKAYVLRYGASEVWIVNPAAGSEAEFKIGELDLSGYTVEMSGGFGNFVPNMVDAVVAGGRLFVLMQRLDASFAPSVSAYVAVFDIATDTEIDTGRGVADGLRGIPLQVRNPNAIRLLPDNGMLYVDAVGRLGLPSFGVAAEYTGGVETIDPLSFQTALVLDDGDAASHPFGQVFGMALVSKSVGYFIATTDAFADSTLYRFDPSTGQVVSDVNGPLAVAGLAHLDLRNVAVDPLGKLWVGLGDPTAPGMAVIDPVTDTLEEALIGTELAPLDTAFCEAG